MRDAVRWLIVLGIVLVLIGLIAYARGDEHHRGDDVGAHGALPAARAEAR
jgi:hypothetical protein